MGCIRPDLDRDPSVEGRVAEFVGVAEERLDAEHVLARGGLRQAGAYAGEGIAHVLDGGGAQAALGSSARKRRAVISKLRWVCGEVSERSQDFSSASSDTARVALTSVMGRLAGSLGDIKPCFACSIIF